MIIISILIMSICFLKHPKKMPPELVDVWRQTDVINPLPRPPTHSASEAERTGRCHLTSELLYWSYITLSSEHGPLNSRSELLYDPELRGGVME